MRIWRESELLGGHLGFRQLPYPTQNFKPVHQTEVFIGEEWGMRHCS